jgi:hypothetical protein
MMGRGTTNVLQTNPIDPSNVHRMIISTYSSTSFHDVARYARIAANASMIRNDPTRRVAPGSGGHPVISKNVSGDMKAHTPKINEVMKPSRKIYFA